MKGSTYSQHRDSNLRVIFKYFWNTKDEVSSFHIYGGVYSLNL